MLIFNLQRKTIVTLDIFYYMPDYTGIIQEFLWQTEDEKPGYRRVHSFLNYWKDNIDAVIKDILLREDGSPVWRSVDFLMNE